MICLKKSADAWGAADFETTFKREIKTLGIDQLPLLQAMRYGNEIIADSISVMINRAIEEPGLIKISAGLFFNSVIAGCNCADDPTPVDSLNEYAEVEFMIDVENGNTRVRVTE